MRLALFKAFGQSLREVTMLAMSYIGPYLIRVEEKADLVIKHPPFKACLRCKHEI